MSAVSHTTAAQQIHKGKILLKIEYGHTKQHHMSLQAALILKRQRITRWERFEAVAVDLMFV